VPSLRIIDPDQWSSTHVTYSQPSPLAPAAPGGHQGWPVQCLPVADLRQQRVPEVQCRRHLAHL